MPNCLKKQMMIYSFLTTKWCTKRPTQSRDYKSICETIPRPTLHSTLVVACDDQCHFLWKTPHTPHLPISHQLVQLNWNCHERVPLHCQLPRAMTCGWWFLWKVVDYGTCKPHWWGTLVSWSADQSPKICYTPLVKTGSTSNSCIAVTVSWNTDWFCVPKDYIVFIPKV